MPDLIHRNKCRMNGHGGGGGGKRNPQQSEKNVASPSNTQLEHSTLTSCLELRLLRQPKHTASYADGNDSTQSPRGPRTGLAAVLSRYCPMLHINAAQHQAPSSSTCAPPTSRWCSARNTCVRASLSTPMPRRAHSSPRPHHNQRSHVDLTCPLEYDHHTTDVLQY